jgi:recombination protein RecA
MTRADTLRQQINKMMGGNVLQMGSDKRYEVDYMSTGLLPIDILLNGGIPRGRFVTVTGAYSTLKSYIGLRTLAEVQRNGGLCALIDTEHAYDPSWARSLGVNTKELIVWPPLDDDEDVTGEEAFDITEVLIRNKLDLIVFDSVAASLPQQEQNKRLSKESVQPGRLAALLSLAMRKLTAQNSKTGMLYINQLREQIGVTFGNPEKATGGRALPYYSSIILNIRAAGYITESAKVYDGDQYNTTKRKVGQRFVGQVQKSKLSTPWTDLYFNYDMRTSAIDLTTFLFAQGVEIGEITKKGNTWSLGGVKAVGKDAFMKKLSASPEELSSLEQAVRAWHGLPLLGPSAHGKKKAVVSKVSSSSSAAPKRTLGRGRAASASTARRSLKSSK